MGCFVCIYLFASVAAFLGVERREGGATGLCGSCRYDLAGLSSASVCPECGSAKREVSGGWSEIVVRRGAFPVWCVTLVVLLFCLMETDLLRAAIDYPWRVRSQNWHYQPTDTPVEPVFMALAVAPLLGRIRGPWLGVGATLLLIGAAYLAGVWRTLR